MLQCTKLKEQVRDTAQSKKSFGDFADKFSLSLFFKIASSDFRNLFDQTFLVFFLWRRNHES